MTKQATQQIRQEIKAAGIKARVRMFPGNAAAVQVSAPAYGVEFTEGEQRAIRQIAVNMGMTWVRRLEIDVEQMTNPHGFDFYV
jgi:hypothetical protein